MGLGSFINKFKAPAMIVGGIATTNPELIAAGLGSMADDASSKAALADDRAYQASINAKNAALQREFAQNGIRWKVADAKAAGVHPLYALGAQGYSASPSYVGSSSLATDMSSFMGQNLSRAIDATRTSGERISSKMEALSLENAELQNDLLRSQIAMNNSAQLGPAMPAGLLGEIKVPAENIASDPDRPAQEAGTITDYGYARSSRGYALVPSADMKNRTDDDLFQQLGWQMRNRIIPPPPPSKKLLPSNANSWSWDPVSGEYIPVKRILGPFKLYRKMQ